MAKVEIKSAFVEEQVGSPVFVLKCAEPHSKKDEQGKYQTESRTFFDLKVSRDSGIDLNFFPKGSRLHIWGNQKTEVREHEGKKFYTLVVWADRVEVAETRGGGQGGGFSAPAGHRVHPGETSGLLRQIPGSAVLVIQEVNPSRPNPTNRSSRTLHASPSAGLF